MIENAKELLGERYASLARRAKNDELTEEDKKLLLEIRDELNRMPLD